MSVKILVAMSGGVDSSVAAKLLVDAGNECVGCTMKLHDEVVGEAGARTCCTLDDVEDARGVALKLGMPYYVFNFKDDFKEKIIDRFVCEYLRGRTPNPCIECNRYMKFDKLFERAALLGCDRIATGHYARVTFENGKYLLKKALDPAKDQSYVLYAMTQKQLSMTLFPLGELRKEQTRAIAESAGFLNAAKPDSQDICFVPDGKYADMIERYTGRKAEEGDYIDKDGKVLGRHKGLIRYTIGQHKGLGIPFEEKMYVTRLDPERNEVTLGRSEELFSAVAETENFHWIPGEAPERPIRCKAKIRYKHAEQDATVTPLENGGVRIVFDEKQRAITPGQAAVLYDGDIVLGGGVICKVP